MQRTTPGPLQGIGLLKKGVAFDPHYERLKRQNAALRQSQEATPSATFSLPSSSSPPAARLPAAVGAMKLASSVSSQDESAPPPPLPPPTELKRKTTSVVMLDASPKLNRDAYQFHASPQKGEEEEEEKPAAAAAAAAVVEEEESPRPKKLVKQTPVPLPTFPGMLKATEGSEKVGDAAASPATPSKSGKGRGRPKGWKPGMSYSHMRGNDGGEAAAGANRRGAARQGRPSEGFGVIKKRGRPPKQPSPPPRDVYHKLNIAFVAFLCEWDGCRAELHNLETLKRHVEVIHVRREERNELQGGGGKPRCWWGNSCSGGGVKMEDVTELRRHVEEEHLIPFGWHVGDGPRNRSGLAAGAGASADEMEEIPAYLRDGEGKQVTPSIQGQVVEDYVTWRNNRRKLRELLLERDRNLPSEEPEDTG